MERLPTKEVEVDAGDLLTESDRNFSAQKTDDAMEGQLMEPLHGSPGNIFVIMVLEVSLCVHE